MRRASCDGVPGSAGRTIRRCPEPSGLVQVSQSRVRSPTRRWWQAPLAAANGPETLRDAGGRPSRRHTRMNSPLGRRSRPTSCPGSAEDLARGSYANLRGISSVPARAPAERRARTWPGTCWRAWPAHRRSTVVQRWRASPEELATGVDPRRRGTMRGAVALRVRPARRPSTTRTSSNLSSTVCWPGSTCDISLERSVTTAWIGSSTLAGSDNTGGSAATSPWPMSPAKR